MPRRSGFTLLEVLVALTLAMAIGIGLFMFFGSLNRNLQRSRRELAALNAIQVCVARLETSLQAIVVKSGYAPGNPPVFKPLDQGMFRLQWPGPGGFLKNYANGAYQDGKCRYLGFYCTEDGTHVNRLEFYFNPPEPAGWQNNGVDDDGDDDSADATNPAHLMIDDRGSLMVRRMRDGQMSYNQYHNTPPDGADSIDAPGFVPYRPPRLTGTAGGEFDRGEIVGDGFQDIFFEFVCLPREKRDGNWQVGKQFQTASCWPRQADGSGAQSSETWPRDAFDGKQPQELSRIALPLAVRVTFVYEIDNERRRHTQTIRLPQSQWFEYLRRRDP